MEQRVALCIDLKFSWQAKLFSAPCMTTLPNLTSSISTGVKEFLKEQENLNRSQNWVNPIIDNASYLYHFIRHCKCTSHLTPAIFFKLHLTWQPIKIHRTLKREQLCLQIIRVYNKQNVCPLVWTLVLNIIVTVLFLLWTTCLNTGFWKKTLLLNPLSIEMQCQTEVTLSTLQSESIQSEISVTLRC